MAAAANHLFPRLWPRLVSCAKSICRTFSDCTTAPRNGLISGCYPLDRYYAAKPESQKLKQIKQSLLS